MQIQGTACRLRNGGDGGGGVLTQTHYSLLPPPSYWQCILSGMVWYGMGNVSYSTLVYIRIYQASNSTRGGLDKVFSAPLSPRGEKQSLAPSHY